MKPICPVTLLLSILIVGSPSHAGKDVSTLKGPYLGQTPPGLTAKPFAPFLHRHNQCTSYPRRQRARFAVILLN